MTWGQLDSLADHFDRHGGDFGARDAEHYARLAWEFRQRARREGLPAKQDEGGVIRVFEARSRSFAAYNRDGTTRTFFKPRSADYFARQPGQPVNLKQLEFRR
jgi:pyocin large subunit-like protein